MNRAKRMEYAIALAELLGWINGKAESDKNGLDIETVDTCQKLLDELKVYSRGS